MNFKYYVTTSQDDYGQIKERMEIEKLYQMFKERLIKELKGE